MLPSPTLSFTIPSIHDDTVLDCRIYHPTSIATTWERKVAIIAHPYAPLGGCYDDPVVDIIASLILKQGFIIGTFNFRGAGSSKGRTSWSAKPEKEDYMSFVGFMVYYLQYLHPPTSSRSGIDANELYHSLATIPSQTMHRPDSPRKRHTSPAKITCSENVMRKSRRGSTTGGLLLLGGYSYGSLITMHLPPTQDILALFSKPEVGSAASEIRLRAQQLAKQQNERLALLSSPSSSSYRGRRSLQVNDNRLAVPHSPGVRIGGEETNPGIRRSSHEGRRSLDSPRLRRSLDKIRSISNHNLPSSPRQSSYSSQNTENPTKKLSKRPSTSPARLTPETTISLKVNPETPNQMEPIEMLPLKTAYLLISPLQGIVKDLATLSLPHISFSKSKPSPYPYTRNDTLAIFGSTDAFTSAKRLRAWATKLEAQDLVCGKTADGVDIGEPSRFRWKEVEGAGHFWNDYEVVGVLREEVREFVRRL